MRLTKPETWQEMRRKHQIKYYHKLSKIEFDKMREDQDYSCAICGIHESLINRPRPLVVDHNHKTGRVRALLCGHCNSALGMLREDAETAASMIEYILQHEAVDKETY